MFLISVFTHPSTSRPPSGQLPCQNPRNNRTNCSSSTPQPTTRLICGRNLLNEERSPHGQALGPRRARRQRPERRRPTERGQPPFGHLLEGRGIAAREAPAVRVLQPDLAAPGRLDPLARRLGQVLQAAHGRERRERLRLAVEELGQTPPAPREKERHVRPQLQSRSSSSLQRTAVSGQSTYLSGSCAMREDIWKLSVDPEEPELEVASSSSSSSDDSMEPAADIPDSDGQPMSSSCSSSQLFPLLRGNSM
uniref:Uncharacterized protein n=1 Tax=Triticum urartu TaxID=4572 RepID=A0A8R7PHU2_TRIUA